MHTIVSFDRLLAILWRRKKLIAGVALLGTVAATLVGMQITPRYTAKTLLLIEPREANLIGLQGAQAGSSVDPGLVETRIKVLTSRSHLQRVIEQSGLESDQEFLPTAGIVSVSMHGVDEGRKSLLDWASRWWPIGSGIAEEPVERLVASEPRSDTTPPAAVAATSEQQILDAVSARLKVAQEGGSMVVGVSFTSTSAEKAAAIANAIARIYVDDELDGKRTAISNVADWLEERLTKLKDELKQAEAAVEQYRVANNLVTGQRTDVTDQQVADLNKELFTAEAELARQEVRLTYIRDLRRRGQSIDSLPEILGSPLIIELRSQEAELARTGTELAGTFGAQHPRMVLLAAERRRLSERINSEIGRIVANLENEVQIAKTRVAAMKAGLDNAQKTSSNAQGAEVHLRELERAAQATSQLYEALLKRYMEMREQREVVEPGAEVISLAAIPTLPSSPGTPLIAAFGFTVATAFGTLLALFRERLDKGLRSESEVMATLGLPRIGLVPRLRGRQRPHRYLISRPRSAYTESMRAILASLRLSAGGKASKVILVTSSVPGEGKTTLAVSLAVYAAASAHRVILVDLDFHHPNVLRELKISPKGGVVDYLHRELRLAEAIEHVEDLNLDILPMYQQMSDSMPLLTSGRVKDMLDSLRDRYDYIIVDSAPVLGVTDAQLLAAEADKVLFVVRWNHTARSLARNAIKLLQVARTDIAGAVLTQVNIKLHGRYNYGDTGECYTKYKKYYQN